MNRDIRDSIGFKVPLWKRLLNHKRTYSKYDDIAMWNTNAIKAFESFREVDLSVILFASNMLRPKEVFEINNIRYIVLRDISDLLIQRIKHKVLLGIADLPQFFLAFRIKPNQTQSVLHETASVPQMKEAALPGGFFQTYCRQSEKISLCRLIGLLEVSDGGFEHADVVISGDVFVEIPAHALGVAHLAEDPSVG